MSKNVYEVNESTIITFIKPIEPLNISKAIEELKIEKVGLLENFEIIKN